MGSLKAGTIMRGTRPTPILRCRCGSWRIAWTISRTAHAYASRLIDPIASRAPAKVDPDIYDAYEGDYYDSGVRQVTVIRSADRLMVKNRTGDLAEVLPETPTVYFYPTGGTARLIFQKNAEGKVVSILYRDDRHEETWERQK